MSLYVKNKSPNIFEKYENNFNIYKENIPDKNILKNDINNYQIKEIIGEGMFGKVRLAIHLLTKEKVAIKIFDKGKLKTQKEKEYIEREIAILKRLNHYNTIKLYNIIQNDEFIFLIQEYIPGKELLFFLENSENLSEKDICKLYQQIISGIEYMREMGIAHRDLKLENILLNYKKDIKIIDFGLSNNYDKDSDELLHSSCGSPCYAAPEMIKGVEYRGINTDIWSSGIILYLMLFKKFPFNDKNNSKLYQKILSGKFIIPNNISDEAKDIITNLLKVNPEERIKLNEIKNHPWFNLFDKNKNYCKGIDINKTIIPIDEEIVQEMNKFGISRNIIINNLLRNNFNNITTTYNLLLQKKIKNGKKSVADFCSDLYINYINNEKNKFSYYNNDIELIIKRRTQNINENNIKVIPSLNIEYGFNRTFGYNHKKFNNYNYLLGKLNHKIISKSDEYTNRQITERQKDKNILLNFPIKFHTIDHDSYSNSKKKKIMNKKQKNISPNLTQFNTKKNNIQYNINTIKNNGFSLNKYLEIMPNTHHYKNIKNNQTKQNYRQYIFNKSLDNYSREKNNGNNNYIKMNGNKFNHIRQIRKKICDPTIEDLSSYTPIETEADKFNYPRYKKGNSLINEYNNFNLEHKIHKTLNHLSNTKYSKDKIKNKSIDNARLSNLNNNHYIINNLKKKVYLGISFNNYTKDINNYIQDNNKQNNLYLEEREDKHKLLSSSSQQKDNYKDRKKIKNKKSSSVSVDLNIRNQRKKEISIYTNRPKRKNVMKFINKNHNNEINGNFRLNNIYNKYGYCYKNEIKKNIHNKSLDTNNNKKLIYIDSYK